MIKASLDSIKDSFDVMKSSLVSEWLKLFHDKIISFHIMNASLNIMMPSSDTVKSLFDIMKISFTMQSLLDMRSGQKVFELLLW